MDKQVLNFSLLGDNKGGCKSKDGDFKLNID